jgi:hypothetical protein
MALDIEQAAKVADLSRREQERLQLMLAHGAARGCGVGDGVSSRTARVKCADVEKTLPLDESVPTVALPATFEACSLPPSRMQLLHASMNEHTRSTPPPEKEQKYGIVCATVTTPSCQLHHLRYHLPPTAEQSEYRMVLLEIWFNYWSSHKTLNSLKKLKIRSL